MANLRTIRKRITGVRNTMQLTRAMKMVAAAKLRRAQDRVEGSRPYIKILNQMIETVNAAETGTSEQGGSLSPLKGDGKVCLVFTSDRGLCGNYNSTILREAARLRSKQSDLKFILFGKKVISMFAKRDWPAYQTYPGFFHNFSWESCVPVVDEILKKCAVDGIGELQVLYTRFVSAGVQRMTHRTLLPFSATDEQSQNSTTNNPMVLIEPDRQVVLKMLVEQYSRFSFYHVACEVIASEHGARMRAMDSATNNAKDMIDHLVLVMNRARQAGITKELLEIIGGKEALEN